MAFANDDLAAAMKQTGKDFKALGQQVTDSSKNASSVTLAQDLAVQLKKSHDLVPDTVDQLQGTERASALADYQNQINDTIAQVQQLITSLQNNDNNTAAAILNKISDLKKTGHGKFNPN
jgi:nitrate/nitrite-specific signal transduction histidine kinase